MKAIFLLAVVGIIVTMSSLSALVLMNNRATTFTNAYDGDHVHVGNALDKPETQQQSVSIAPTEQQQQQRIVIFPGPHKAASTYIQNCMVLWSLEDELLGHWKWAVPEQHQLAPYIPTLPVAEKRTASLFKAFHRRHYRTTLPKVKSIFRATLRNAWKDGHSILFGSEGMDRLLSAQFHPQKFFDTLYDVLPKDNNNNNNNTNMEVVVVYRSPRSEQLVSLWGQLDRKRQPLSQFLKNEMPSILYKIDGLALALAFLDRGLPTTVLDLDGSRKSGVDACEAVVCDVLQEPCTPEKRIISIRDSATNSTPFRNNKRGDWGEVDLSEEQLTEIGRYMDQYDCGLRKKLLESNPPIRILYQDSLFRTCNNLDHEHSEKWLSEKIISALEAPQ